MSTHLATDLVATYMAFDADFSNLRTHLTVAVGNIFLAGLAIIALLALFNRKITVVVEVIILGILVAVVIYDPAVLKGFADAIAGILGATGPIGSTPAGG
jgi:hypothetical protein